MTATPPRTDDFMSDTDLTNAADLIKGCVDWRRLPKLAGIFQHCPCENLYWHELVKLTLQSLNSGVTADIVRMSERAKLDRNR
jgi:hypothetical protein